MLYLSMKLPSSWKEITIKNFVEAYDILLDTNYDIIDKNLHLLSALSGQPFSYYETLPLVKLKQAISQVQFMNDLKSIDTRLPLSFIIGKTVYDVVHDPSKLSGGQYIDLMNILSQCSTQKEINEHIHDLLAVICVPRRFIFFKGKYDGAQHKEVAELFYHKLTMNVAYPVALFFCKLWEHLTPTIKTYLESEKQEILEMAMKRCQTLLTQDGVGS